MVLAMIFAATTLSQPVSEFYLSAIHAMEDIPQPSYVSYHMDGTPDGFQIGLIVQGGNLWLNFGKGSTPSHWSLQHRTYDYRSELVDAADGKRYTTARSFFDPTWYGAYRALHEGMLGAQDPAPPRSQGSTPTSPPVLHTIAVTSVMGTGTYHVEDRGDAQCSNGNAGRALHVWSIQRNVLHQLSDVIVEMQSMRFCMMRFSVADTFGFHGIVEQHFAVVGGYWMQTDGLLDGTLRAFGVSLHHGSWRYRLSDMQFPAALPDSTFAKVDPEREGFEPSRPLTVCSLSKRVPSTTRPPLRKKASRFQRGLRVLALGGPDS